MRVFSCITVISSCIKLKILICNLEQVTACKLAVLKSYSIVTILIKYLLIIDNKYMCITRKKHFSETGLFVSYHHELIINNATWLAFVQQLSFINFG